MPLSHQISRPEYHCLKGVLAVGLQLYSYFLHRLAGIWRIQSGRECSAHHQQSRNDLARTVLRTVATGPQQHQADHHYVYSWMGCDDLQRAG